MSREADRSADVRSSEQSELPGGISRDQFERLRFMSRRRFGSIAGAAIGSIALAACAKNNNSGGSTSSAEATTLTVVTPDTSIIWTIDKAFGGLEPSDNVQATLLRKPYVKSSVSSFLEQNTAEFEGLLASGYTKSADGLVYTFKLRDAISAAGNHLTYEDVRWSFERKFKTATSISPGVMAPEITDPEKQFKKVDDHTFTLTLDQAGYGVTMLALMSDLTCQIYDSTLLKKHVTAADPYAVNWSAENPNFGFGAYEVTSYQQGVQTVLSARKDYVLGKPAIDKLIFKIISDAGTRANAVKTGAADLAEALQPSDLANLKATAGVKVVTVSNPNVYLELPLVTNKAPFNDVLVRQAMAWAVPYQQIVENVYHGQAVRHGSGFLLRNAPGYTDAGEPAYAYDPAKAKALLKKAGHPNGIKFTLSISAAQPDTREAATQIQTYAAKAGFDITIDQLPASAFGTGRSAHTFEAFLLDDYAITLTPGYELLVYTAKGSANNLGDWEYPPFYAALAKANASADPYSAEAGKLWNAAEQIYIDQAPILFIAQIQPQVAMAAKVDGYAWRSDAFIDFSVMSIAKT